MTQPITTTPRAEINKTKSKKQPFRTNFIGENGGDVGGSKETLTTRLNAEKNIKAHIGCFSGTGIFVVDHTNKTCYHMDKDGLKSNEEKFS